MRSLVFLFFLLLNIQPAFSQDLNPDSKPDMTEAIVKVSRNDDGKITIDGETIGQRHPKFEKFAAKPVKKVCKPLVWLGNKTGFFKAKNFVSDLAIVAGAKYQPYEPLSGAVVTTNQLLNLTVPRFRK